MFAVLKVLQCRIIILRRINSHFVVNLLRLRRLSRKCELRLMKQSKVTQFKKLMHVTQANVYILQPDEI